MHVIYGMVISMLPFLGDKIIYCWLLFAYCILPLFSIDPTHSRSTGIEISDEDAEKILSAKDAVDFLKNALDVH